MIPNASPDAMEGSPAIEWICAGVVPPDDRVGVSETSSYKIGGEIYNDQALHALRQVAPVEVRHFPRPNEPAGVAGLARKVRYLVSLARYKPTGPLTIWEGGSLYYGVVRKRQGKRQIGLVHHFELDNATDSRRLLTRRLVKNLRNLDAVVTVSEYWRSTLVNLGARNVHVIHNSAPTIPINFTAAELRRLEQQCGLTGGKPLVYLGTSERKKGVLESYLALANEGYELVVTGGQPIPELSVRRLELSARDYLLLLTRCDVAVLMSRFPEGWSRVAAEAMFCGTPVVGSGLGGMRELLSDGGQIICDSFNDLPAAVRRALDDREALSQRGREFAEKFTHARFSQEWQALARSLA